MFCDGGVPPLASFKNPSSNTARGVFEYLARFLASKTQQIGMHQHIVFNYGFQQYTIPVTGKPLVATLTIFLDQKCNQVRKSAAKAYKGMSNAFMNWLIDNGHGQILTDQLTPAHCAAFLDALSAKGAGNRTRNGYLANLKTIFNELRRRGEIAHNPWESIPRLRQDAGHHVIFTPGDRQLIEPVLAKHPRLWLFTRMLYYAFIRPNELVHLRYQHIDLSARQICVPGEVSKNRKTQYVPMAGPLFRMLADELAQNGKDSSRYLFSTNKQEPGPTPGHGNKAWIQHRKIQERVGLASEARKGVTLYTWKHTGVVAAYRAGVRIRAIQTMCRHHDITETERYLRSLGLEHTEDELLGKAW